MHGNARQHVTRVVENTLLQLEWEVQPCPAYAPDMVLSNYLMIRSMQYGLPDTQFHKVEDVRNWVNDSIVAKRIWFCARGVAMLLERREKIEENDRKHYY